jgi:signal transduction histidine kinase
VNAARASLRVRLLIGTLFWIVATIVAAGWGLSGLFRDHVSEQFHGELQTHLDQLTANLAVDDNGKPRLLQPLSDPRLSRPYSGCYWQVDAIDGAGGLLRSRSLWDHVLAVPPDALADGELHSHRIAGPDGRPLAVVERSVRLDDVADGRPRRLRLIAAAEERLMEAPVARFNETLWLALAILGSGLGLAVLVQVAVGLAPLRKLRGALSRVRAGDAQRLDGDFPREIAPLVDEFNLVLAAHAGVVAGARAQAGDLAHALKTPLAVLANAANSAAAAEKESELASVVAEQVAIARRQVDYHLARAQAAAALHPAARTPLAPAIDGLVRTMRRLHAERPITLAAAPIDASLVFRGDLHELHEMLGNLLDNACKWAASRIDVSAGMAAGQLHIVIDDDGPGMAPAQVADVLQRGVRADEKIPGSGLGLAIVDDLARRHGGGITLARSPLGGLRATLALPAAQANQAA